MDKTRAWRGLYKQVASLFELPPWLLVRPEEHNPDERRLYFQPQHWLEGLLLVESGGDPYAMRYEPQLDKGRGDPDTPQVHDGFKEDDQSYGLMQVLGTNVRWIYGLGGLLDYQFCLRPLINLDVGCAVLSHFLERAEGVVPAALAMYNMGNKGADLIDGKYRNQQYVDKVASHTIEVFHDLGGSPY